VNVLITHECSGMVSSEFRKLGHRAYSCDLKESEREPTGNHLVMDAIEAIKAGCPDPMGSVGGVKRNQPWHLIGMHCDCTFLNSAGLHWNERGRGHEKTNAALKHVSECMDAATSHAIIGWYLENPAGKIGTAIRPWDQMVQPYMFGDDASKKTGLWLHGLPKLQVPWSDDWVKPRWVCSKCKRVSTHKESANWVYAGHITSRRGKRLCHRCEGGPVLLPRWSNQTDSGQNRLAPGPTRAVDRARTYPGIAKAMAAQWTSYLR
jgi:hypothetical protein